MTGLPIGRNGGRRERRGPKRRGVAGVVATLLLVAIVVVLAAVLYLIVLHAVSDVRSSQPLAAAFAAGPSTGVEGTAATAAFCQKSHYCDSVPVQYAGAGITLGSLDFKVVSSSGADHVVTMNYAQLSVVNDRNQVIAYSQLTRNAAFVVNGWSHYENGGAAATPVSSTLVFWVQFGNTNSSPFGQGMSLEVVGAGSFSGVVPVALA
jgi:flagellin-like protein